MTPISERVEFMSDAWLAAAQAFLVREFEARRGRLGGQAFSLSERFTDAPPHLQLPGDVGQWSVSSDGRTIAISRAFDPSADLVVEGDYQAALMSAQGVGAGAPGVMAGATREIAHWYGADALRFRGAFPAGLAGQEVATLFAQLHDHLARRTLENPDLAHRARRQGLVAQVREMEENGYAIIEGALSPEAADAMRGATLNSILSHQETNVHGLLYHGRPFENLIQNPFLMTLVEASLGRGAVVGAYVAQRKGPGPGAIPNHTDYALVPEPYPDFAMTGVAVWAFEDWTVESGPTFIVPGSHRNRRAPRPEDGHEGGVPVVMRKGSVVWFTHGVWHWQGERTQPGERVTVHAQYMRCILRSMEPKLIDPPMLHRNPPRLTELLGEDDGFDKTREDGGRYYDRFAHMAQLTAYSARKKAELLMG